MAEEKKSHALESVDEVKSLDASVGFVDASLDAYVEFVTPNLVKQDVSAPEVIRSKVFMCNEEGISVPIHPEPNNEQRVSKFIEKYEIIVTELEENPDNGNYIRITIPCRGWIRKSMISDGTMVEVTPDTLTSLITLNADSAELNRPCSKWLNDSDFLRGLSVEIRKHPIYLMAGLVALHVLSELIIFADLITDIRVAGTLMEARMDVLFMLTVVFLLAPYYITWAAAFGYLQKKAMDSTARSAESSTSAASANNNGTVSKKVTETDDFKGTQTAIAGASNNDDENDEKKSSNEDEEDDEDDEIDALFRHAPAKSIQMLVLIFSIAPVGVVILIFLDVYLLIEDLFVKPIYLLWRKDQLREESHAEQGYKKLRRVSEVVAETICQFVLQFIIVLRYWNNDKIDISIVIGSLITSGLVLIIWGTVLRKEANDYGLHLYEYVTVVLQGSFNFVPFLPAIERGKREYVNWTNFRFDSHSVGLVSKALISPDCELKAIKMSAYSLKKLSKHESKFLGQMLADSPKNPVEVLFSRSRREIQILFEKFDTDNSRTFDFLEFVRLCAALRQSDDGVVSAMQVAQIFAMICDKSSKQVYMTDLLMKISATLNKVPVIDYDTPVTYALRVQESDPNLLTFMLSSKVVDDVTWEFYTSMLVTSGRHKDALLMCEERGCPIVVEVIRGRNLEAHDEDGYSDPYVSVSIAGQVHRTETRLKTLNPIWKQSLLFTIPFDQLPDELPKDENDARFKAGFPASEPKHRRRLSQGPGTLSRGQTGGGQGGNGPDGSSGGGGGGGGVEVNKSRLEIGLKVYDYDEGDDDDFMGNVKHFLKWTEKDLIEHQSPASNTPITLTRKLKNRGEDAGELLFRIYVGTARYWIKWGAEQKDELDGKIVITPTLNE